MTTGRRRIDKDLQQLSRSYRPKNRTFSHDSFSRDSNFRSTSISLMVDEHHPTQDNDHTTRCVFDSTLWLSPRTIRRLVVPFHHLSVNMEPTDDPYVILGVPANATARDIRTAYRRLALEHHPDRNPGGGTNNNNGERCVHTTMFAKINHAYEVLTDPEAQRSWDRAAAVSASTQEQPAQQPQGRQHAPYNYYHHDPFSVFESVFREDFGRDFSFPRGAGGHHHGMSPFSSSFFSSFGGGRDPFDDPFFRRPNGPAASGMMNHQHWPFSARGTGGLFPHNNDTDDLFGRGEIDDLFRSPWEDAARKHHHHHHHHPHGQPSSSSSSFYSSSTVSRRNSQGEWVTETTENRNGQVTTERVTHDARGNIVRSEMIEDDRGDNDHGARRQRQQQLPATEASAVAPPPSSQHNNGMFRMPWQRRGGDE
jgi:curved DNA-binding protein CbpA